jgi:hypothetical protein
MIIKGKKKEMMKRIKLLLFIGALFCLSSINGQTVNLRLDSSSLAGLPNIVNLNSAYHLTIIIHNDSSATYHGDITFGGTINGDSVSADTIASGVLYYESMYQSVTIAGGDTIMRELIINVLSPDFIIGTSGVVIWPKALFPLDSVVNISDSLGKTVTVLYPLGLDEIVERNLKVYMSDQQLIIRNNGNYLLQNVKLYDLSGKLLNEEQLTNSGTLNLNQYAEGVYLTEINFADNTRMIFKVFNTR